MPLIPREMMKADRMALLTVALVLLIVGCILGARSCREAGRPDAGPVVIVDTVVISRQHAVSDSDSIRSRKRPKHEKRKKVKAAPKPPRPRDYSGDIIPPVK